jgi:hypothetical protein
MARLQHAVEWTVAASPDAVWAMLADYQRWPGWWRGIQSVELVRPGGEDGVGSVLRQRWRSRLPLTLCFDLEMVRIEATRLLDGRASGDLEGTCTWTLQRNGGDCRVRFSVDVRAGRWWMRLPVPFADRVFRANFDTVMSWGLEGLQDVLGTTPQAA